MVKIGLFVLWMLLPLNGAATTLLVMGDSLSAAHGIAVEQGWVALLKQRFNKEHKPVSVVNASISGETSSGGRRRLPSLLNKHHPDIVILELGGNDGLRGILPGQMEKNLANMIEASQRSDAKVLLLGMKIPTNYGPRYARQFEAVYQRLAQRYEIAFIPFFLEEVALDANLMQNDGIHPNAKAQPELVEQVWNQLTEMLD